MINWTIIEIWPIVGVICWVSLSLHIWKVTRKLRFFLAILSRPLKTNFASRFHQLAYPPRGKSQSHWPLLRTVINLAERQTQRTGECIETRNPKSRQRSLRGHTSRSAPSVWINKQIQISSPRNRRKSSRNSLHVCIDVYGNTICYFVALSREKPQKVLQRRIEETTQIPTSDFNLHPSFSNISFAENVNPD